MCLSMLGACLCMLSMLEVFEYAGACLCMFEYVLECV